MNNNTFTPDEVSIRKALNLLGLDNSKIGWDGNNVTYGGKARFLPDKNENGSTSVNANSFIRGVNDIYNDTNEDNVLSDVSKYAAMSGYDNLIDYSNDGTVTIGGVPVSNVVIIDGQAYAPSDDIKSTLSRAKSASNSQTPLQTFNNYYGNNTQNKSRIENIVSKLTSLEDFKYNPEEDEMYNIYKQIYESQGKNALDDTYARLSNNTGGYANSAAISAGNEAYYSYLDKLNSIIPTLEEKAYKKYTDNFNRDAEILKMLGTPKDLYEYEQSAQELMNKNINSALNNDYNRSKDINEALNNWDYKKKQLENETKKFDYNVQKDNDEKQYIKERDAIEDNRYNEKAAYDKSVKEKELDLKKQSNDRENEKQAYEIPLLRKKLEK